MKSYRLIDPGTIPTKVIDCDVKEMNISTLQSLIHNKGLPKQFYPHLTKEQLNQLTDKDWDTLVSSRQDLHMLLFQPIHKRGVRQYGTYDLETKVEKKEGVRIPQALKIEWKQKGWLPEKGESTLPVPKALSDLGVSFDYSPNKESRLWFEKEASNARYFSETFDYVDEYGRYTPRINIRNQFPLCGTLAPYQGSMGELDSKKLNAFLEDGQNAASFPKFLIPRLTEDQLKGLSEKAWGNLIRSPQDAQALFFKVDFNKRTVPAGGGFIAYVVDPSVEFREELWALVPQKSQKRFLKQAFLPSEIEGFDYRGLKKDSSLSNEGFYIKDSPSEGQLPFWKEQPLGICDVYGRFQRSPGPILKRPLRYNRVAAKTIRAQTEKNFKKLDSTKIGEMIDEDSFPKRLYPHLSAKQMEGLTSEQLTQLIQNKEDFRAIFYSTKTTLSGSQLITYANPVFSFKQEHWEALPEKVQEQFRREGYLAS